MRILSLVLPLALAATSWASALTTPIAANERQCYYVDVDKAGEKIGVRSFMSDTRDANTFVLVLFCCMSCGPRTIFTPNICQVQSGGSFDIDFEVRDPNQKVLLDGQRERQGDFVLTANTVGEYSFCFENDMSTLTEKLVDFDIMVESEPRREPPAKAGQVAEHTSALEESVFRLNGLLMNIKRMQN